MTKGAQESPPRAGFGPLAAVWRAVGGAAAALARPTLALLERSGDPRAAALAERLALDDLADSVPRGCLWLHGASVGEIRALKPLAAALAAARPDLPILVTATTRAGRERAAAELPGRARLAPLDAVAPLRRFLDAAAPRLHVVVETEIWPTRLALLARRGVPAAIVSARLSPERAARYSRLGGLYGPCLRSLALLAPASADDRVRLLAAGADEARLGPVENLKWDAAPAPPADGAKAALAAELGADAARTWIVLGSAHPGEAAPLVAATRAALGPAADGVGWLVAPRHPDRFAAEAESLAAILGPLWPASRGPAPNGAAALLLDKIGLLPRIYPLAAAALLGGTFAPVGGHTPLEAAVAGCPLVAGPHVQHQLDLLAPLVAAGGVKPAASFAEAGAQLARWVAAPDEARAAGAAIQAEVALRRGVAGRLAAVLAGLAR